MGQASCLWAREKPSGRRRKDPARRAEPGSERLGAQGHSARRAGGEGCSTGGRRAQGGSPNAARGAGEQRGFAPRAFACADDMTPVIFSEDDSCVQSGLEGAKMKLGVT